MKAIATINFKGGVGKTTVTWLLAKYLAEEVGKKVLIVDTDAQMSLTLAVRIAVEQGSDASNEVSKFVEANSKERLRAFIAANALPIDRKKSKQSVSIQLVQLLRQSKAIGAPVKSLSKDPSGPS